MGLSENTVKVHLVTIYRVLGVSSRNEALLAGLKQLTPRPYRQ
jgi:DNA-binding CsgD family transcriptional regulator